MKPKIKKKELMTQTAIVNAVMQVLSEAHISPENPTLNQARIVYNYYSEMESGGHESLFRWFGEEINALGMETYSKQLIKGLEEIGAHDYATIEKKYGKELWRLYVALENEEIEEEAFYRIVEQATDDYYKLGDALRARLESYFVAIYQELIEVVEE